MAELFHRNSRQIQQVFNEYQEGSLIIDRSYQRRNVWSAEDRVRLIETILLGLIIPEVFFWMSRMDPETGKSETHIVDGQQRIDAIVSYMNDDFPLVTKHLLDETMKSEVGGKTFSELSAEQKTTIRMYHLSVVEIASSFTREEIMIMFHRLNLTEYSLNNQERLRRLASAFGEKAESLAQKDFWKMLRVFSSEDFKRMNDIRFCAGIYILAMDGIVDQTNDNVINQYYDDYREHFDVDNKVTNQIIKAMDMIEEINDRSTRSFAQKKTQIYTQFSLMLALIEEGVTSVSDEMFERYAMFVKAYNAFKNEFSISFSDARTREVNELIKKYKLASSEGINKVGNRNIRYHVLRDIVINAPSDIVSTLKKLATKYSIERGKDIVRELLDNEEIAEMKL